MFCENCSCSSSDAGDCITLRGAHIIVHFLSMIQRRSELRKIVQGVPFHYLAYLWFRRRVAASNFSYVITKAKEWGVIKGHIKIPSVNYQQ